MPLHITLSYEAGLQLPLGAVRPGEGYMFSDYSGDDPRLLVATCLTGDDGGMIYTAPPERPEFLDSYKYPCGLDTSRLEIAGRIALGGRHEVSLTTAQRRVVNLLFVHTVAQIA